MLAISAPTERRLKSSGFCVNHHSTGNGFLLKTGLAALGASSLFYRRIHEHVYIHVQYYMYTCTHPHTHTHTPTHIHTPIPIPTYTYIYIYIYIYMYLYKVVAAQTANCALCYSVTSNETQYTSWWKMILRTVWYSHIVFIHQSYKNVATFSTALLRAATHFCIFLPLTVPMKVWNLVSRSWSLWKS